MNEYQTGAVRDTGGKGRMDLLPWCALIRISRHMEDAILPDPRTGKIHYPERNWEKGLPIHSMIDSAFRHLAKYMDGQTDEDHLCAAATNLLMAMWTEMRKPDMQDIPSRMPSVASSLRSGDSPGTVDRPTEEAQENARKKPPKRCSAYHTEDGSPRCWGTADKLDCTCGGDTSKCNYYIIRNEEHR